MGTTYDATQEIPGWDGVGFDDSAWQAPVVGRMGDSPVPEDKEHGRGAHATLQISAYPGDAIRTQEEIKPLKIAEPTPNVYVFDLGQNMVGWARFKLNAEKGQELTFRYSEMLTPEGTPYTIPLRGARVIDHYIAKGGGEETWAPIFTSHGFRYVEITGLKEKPSLDAVTGVVAHADIPRTGYFESSSEAVNKLFHNIIWGQKGNYTDVPTDCPQRDERLGWTGDAQFFVPTAAYNFEVDAFFTKWLVDLDTDAQYPDGSFADVAPDLTGGHGNVAWGDAGIVCPYTMYKRYGDTRIIRQHYAEMARYIDFLTKSSKDFIRGQGGYGDWLNLGGGAKSEVVGTAYYHYVTGLMSEMAGAIGKTDDAKKYEKLSDDIKAAFIKNFVADDGSIKDSSQTGYALAFTMDLIPADKKAAAAEKFVDEIKKKNWHLATGFIGTPRLLPALTDAGRNDIAYKLFLTDTFPSWLYQVKLGSTTMWERWDGWTPDKGFQDPAMNSFNHYAFGSVGQWMYGTIGGISTDGAGFKKIHLHPQPGDGLTFAKTKYESIRGTIASEWKQDSDGMSYQFTVPINKNATVMLAAKDAKAITEAGKPLADSTGVNVRDKKAGIVTLELHSGRYTFAVKCRGVCYCCVAGADVADGFAAVAGRVDFVSRCGIVCIRACRSSLRMVLNCSRCSGVSSACSLSRPVSIACMLRSLGSPPAGSFRRTTETSMNAASAALCCASVRSNFSNINGSSRRRESRSSSNQMNRARSATMRRTSRVSFRLGVKLVCTSLRRASRVADVSMSSARIARIFACPSSIRATTLLRTVSEMSASRTAWRVRSICPSTALAISGSVLRVVAPASTVTVRFAGPDIICITAAMPTISARASSGNADGGCLGLFRSCPPHDCERIHRGGAETGMFSAPPRCVSIR